VHHMLHDRFGTFLGLSPESHCTPRSASFVPICNGCPLQNTLEQLQRLYSTKRPFLWLQRLSLHLPYLVKPPPLLFFSTVPLVGNVASSVLLPTMSNDASNSSPSSPSSKLRNNGNPGTFMVGSVPSCRSRDPPRAPAHLGANLTGRRSHNYGDPHQAAEKTSYAGRREDPVFEWWLVDRAVARNCCGRYWVLSVDGVGGGVQAAVQPCRTDGGSSLGHTCDRRSKRTELTRRSVPEVTVTRSMAITSPASSCESRESRESSSSTTGSSTCVAAYTSGMHPAPIVTRRRQRLFSALWVAVSLPRATPLQTGGAQGRCGGRIPNRSVT
jgi:hypothetical protein